MQKTQELSVSGDLEGAKVAFAEATSALNTYVDLVEAESRDGRLNSIKISVGVHPSALNPKPSTLDPKP